jgi:5'-nucleotidase
MDILLTNDDGILHPGLAAMHRMLRDFGEVHVVAPETGQSAAGHSITLNSPLVARRVHAADFFGWAVDGRPADCVKLALLELLGRRPQLVVAGLNAGGNSGVNVLYSGTVAAAVEGALYGIASVAFSLYTERDFDFDRGCASARRVLERVLAGGLFPGMLLNVNIPQTAGGAPPRGIRVVPQSVERWNDAFDRRTDPRGRTYFWLAGSGGKTAKPETDDHLLQQGYVTVTPLHWDLTHRAQLDRIAAWPWDAPVEPQADR